MILLDPDLEPPKLDVDFDADPARSAPAGKQSAPAAQAQSRKQRLPSARALSRFLREAQTAVRLRGQVTVLLTTDRRIRQLNRKFRGKSKATDVLSFPAEAFIHDRERLAGDLAISVETARRQGAACGHPLGIEIKVLILHGLLHLAGYDHETDSGQMARRERLLRARLRLPVGLIERADGASVRRGGRAGRSVRRRRP